MKAILLFSLLFICSIASYPQEQEVYTSGEIALLPGGYSVHSPARKVSDIGFQNPAFISRFNGTSFGISYQYVTSIEKAYFADDNIMGRSFAGGQIFSGRSIVHLLPYSASVTYQSGNIYLAAALVQRYNLMYESPVVEIHPIGYKNMSRYEDIHDYSAIASYLIKNMPEDNSLSLGLKVSLGRLNYASYNRYGALVENLETGIYSFGYSLGSDYRFAMKSGILALGAFYEKGEKFSKSINKLPQFYDNGNGAEVVYSHYSLHVIDAASPDELTFDASLETAEFLFAARASEVFWKRVSDIYKNNLDYSASLTYNGMKHLSLFLGAAMNKRIYANNPKSELTDYKALFITIGEETVVGNYTFGFSVLDSHLNSAYTRKQTIGRMSLSYQF